MPDDAFDAWLEDFEVELGKFNDAEEDLEDEEA